MSPASAKDAPQHVTFGELLLAVCEEAHDSVQRTPSLLPVLKEAGVVDAGGWGLAIFLQGLLKGFHGEELEDTTLQEESISSTFVGYLAGSLPTVEHGFDIQFLAHHPQIPIDEMRTKIQSMGEFGLVEGNSEMVKVHVHALDPGSVLSWGSACAFLTDIVVENLDAQAAEAANKADDIDSGLVSELQPARSDELSLVAVAAGKGFSELFASLGANCVIQCNDTYNPSVGQFQEAILSAGGNHTIVLPNHSNALPAAQAALAALSDGKATIIDTPFVLAGVAATYRFNPVGTARELVVQWMSKAAREAVYGTLAIASRASRGEFGSVAQGEFVVLAMGETVLGGSGCLEEAVRLLVTNFLQPRFLESGQESPEILTVYRGADARPEQNQVLEKVISQHTELELEWVDSLHGGHLYMMVVE